MRWILTLALLFSSIDAFADGRIELSVQFSKPLRIGYLSEVQLRLKNSTGRIIAILEMQPEQPCESAVSFLQPLYGTVEYDAENDRYHYDSMQQQAGLVPLIDAVLFSGESMTKKILYRPFAKEEAFTVVYAMIGDAKIYSLQSEEGSKKVYAPNDRVRKKVIVGGFAGLPQMETRETLVFKDITGEPDNRCYSETLKKHVEKTPFSMYKGWDSGATLLFRVGDKQQGTGPEPRSAGWKFLDRFDVVYGDGMYTHGEFVQISPEDAVLFMELLGERYSIKEIDYFFGKTYYDLEPMP